MTRRFPWGMPRLWAIRSRWAKGDCEQVHSVTWSDRSQRATATCGSMGTCWIWGRRKVPSTMAAQRGQAASTSPRRSLKCSEMLVPGRGKIKLATR